MLTFAITVAIAVFISISVGLIPATPVVVAIIVAILGESGAAETESCGKGESYNKNHPSAKSLHDVPPKEVAPVKTPLQ